MKVIMVRMILKENLVPSINNRTASISISNSICHLDEVIILMTRGFSYLFFQKTFF